MQTIETLEKTRWDVGANSQSQSHGLVWSFDLIWPSPISLFTNQFFLRYHDLNLEYKSLKIMVNQIWFTDHHAFDWSATN